jgi:hypothetical protein
MKMEMSYLLLAFATVLAPLAQGQSTPPQPKITGVLTILTPKPGVTVEQVMKIMPAEIRATWRRLGPSWKACLFRRKTSWTSSSFRSGHSCRSGYYCEIAQPISELGDGASPRLADVQRTLARDSA